MQRFRKQPAPLATSDPFECQWQEDLRTTGADSRHMWAVETGIPLLALVPLLGAGVLGLVGAGGDARATWLALVVLAIGCLPWAAWLLRGDDGPTLTFMAISQMPIALLGLGHCGWNPLSPGPDLTYPLLVFPGLLLVIVSLAAIPIRETVMVCIGVYLAGMLPVLVALANRWEVDPMAVVTWHVGFALSLVAGYAARLGYQASLTVAAARETLALQEAADERRQIARDVHDVVAHTLAVTMLHMTAARMAVQRNDSTAAVSALEEAERQGRSSLTDVRRIVRLLRADAEPGLDQAQPGLGDVHDLLQRYRAAGLQVTFDLPQPLPQASPSTELALFRVLQEALTNASRYGQGSATVALRTSGSTVELEVSNPVARTESRRTRGSGLTGMQERIAAAGGSLVAGAREGTWVVQAMVPGDAAS